MSGPDQPSPKVWDADLFNRSAPSQPAGYETADFVDGWNAALEACQPWIAGCATARDDVERLTKMNAQAERAMYAANEAAIGFEALAGRYFAAKEPLELVADAARRLVTAHDASEAYDDRSPVVEVESLRRALAEVTGEPS